MGSPLSSVLANLFLEMLEFKPFKQIQPIDTYYFRYINDILIIYPKEQYYFHCTQTTLKQELISHMNLKK